MLTLNTTHRLFKQHPTNSSSNQHSPRGYANLLDDNKTWQQINKKNTSSNPVEENTSGAIFGDIHPSNLTANFPFDLSKLSLQHNCFQISNTIHILLERCSTSFAKESTSTVEILLHCHLSWAKESWTNTLVIHPSTNQNKLLLR